jgi:hypothetical protein
MLTSENSFPVQIVQNAQFLSIFLLLFFRKTIFRLSHFKFAVAHEGDETNSKVSATQIQRKVFSSLLS